MRQRLLSAAVLVPVVVIVFFAGQPWLTIAIALLGAAAGYEAALLVRAAGLGANLRLVIAAPPIAVAGLLVAFVTSDHFFPPFASHAWLFFAPVLGLWLIGTAIVSFREADPRSAFLGWVGTLFASGYASLLALIAGVGILGWGAPINTFLTRPIDLGQMWLLALVLTIWSLDSAAYVVGRSFPRGRFMNHISPNKTWSGAVGGTIAAVVVCAAVMLVTLDVPLLIGALIGLAIAVAAQAGDLAESMLKRAAGVKDSGSLIPGHGGVLDRVDSFIFAAPVMYVALLILYTSPGLLA